MARKIRKGDQVIVLTGKDKGRHGAVLEVLASGHVIVEKAMPLAVSKVAIFNPASKKADRIGFKTLTDGKKVRFFKSNGEMIDA